MRVLVAWGSKMGGTEGIARIVGEELEKAGQVVVLAPAADVHSLDGFGAAVVGGGLYANRWERSARHLVGRNIGALRRIPVWLFSSGPLDDSAERSEIPAPRQVTTLMERIGALGHATFGGRIDKDAKGFPASAIAKKNAGDWRNPEHVRRWAAEVARAIPTARAGEPVEPPGGSLGRLLAYGIAGWAACGAVMGALLFAASPGAALAVHAIAAPLIFLAISIRYFGARGARDPLLAATAFTAIVALLDAVVVAGLLLRSFAMFASIAGTWLPFVLIFLVTWATGTVVEMMPSKTHAR